MNLTDRWITQSDQLTKEQSRRTAFRNTVAYVTGKWWRSVLLLAIVMGVFFAVDMIILGPRSETVTMTLNYEQASDGLTPNATRFNMYEIKTEPVLQALARYAGLAGRVSTDDLAECIQVENTQEDVRRVIRAERRVELCCENNRWYDIRRWKDAENLPEMCGDDWGMNFQGRTQQEFFKRTVYQTRVWKRQYYWMPIYIDEYEKNPNLREAPFWVIEKGE